MCFYEIFTLLFSFKSVDARPQRAVRPSNSGWHALEGSQDTLQARRQRRLDNEKRKQRRNQDSTIMSPRTPRQIHNATTKRSRNIGNVL